jgi:transposase-like protein
MERKDMRMHPEDVGAGSTGSKRRRHVLTIQQKVEVLRKIDHRVSVSRLCREYGVGQSTILLILWNESHTAEQEIMQIYRLKEKFEKERCSMSKQTTLTDLFKRAVASPNPSLSADSVTRNPDNK